MNIFIYFVLWEKNLFQGPEHKNAGSKSLLHIVFVLL